MIRFRTGHRWKKQADAAPVDRFALEVDGVDILGGVGEEHLASLMPELISSIYALATNRALVSEVSLAEAHLELCLFRNADEVEARVVRLARPAQLLRGPFRLDFDELKRAAARCARTLCRDMAQLCPDALPEGPLQQLRQRAGWLLQHPSVPQRTTGAAERQLLFETEAIGFELSQAQNLLWAYRRRGQGALTSLLSPGKLKLKCEGLPPFQGAGIPFLQLLELSRQAGDFARAMALGEAEFQFHPANMKLQATVLLKKGEVKVGKETYPVPAAALLKSMWQAGLDCFFALAARHRAQSHNPYLQEMAARCRAGLNELRHGAPPSPRSKLVAARKSPRRPAKPLSPQGKIRKLRFDKLWRQDAGTGQRPGRLLLASFGVAFFNGERVTQYGRDGALLLRRSSEGGVALSERGEVVCAEPHRLLGFLPGVAGARWIRSAEQISLGASLCDAGGHFLALSQGRALIALSKETGREIWRLVPPRAGLCRLWAQGPLALLATEAGSLYGIHAEDGAVHYRLAGPLPLVGKPCIQGRKLWGVWGSKERTALFSADSQTGQLAWTAELLLSRPTSPLPWGNFTAIAGEREGTGRICLLDASGQKLWEHSLLPGPGPFALSIVNDAAVLTSASGEACACSPDGSLRWTLPAGGDGIASALPAAISRGILFVAGESVRAVEPNSGRVLAHVDGGIGLCDLAVDEALNLFMLDEWGHLSAHRLSTHLSVV